MIRFYFFFLWVFTAVLGHAQGTMNIYQTNGSILQVALSSIDSVTYQTTPPPLMRIHQTGGSILSLAVADIDSITYSTGGAPGTAQVATLPASAVGSTTAVCAGTINSDGGSTITARGICYSTIPLPNLSGPTVSTGAGLGTFQVQLQGLQPNTLYYARAYATNTQGTAYGNEVAFTTGFDPGGGVLPTVVTTEPFGVNGYSANTGGQVTSDGGNTVVARGVVWSTGPNPTQANSFTVNGAGMGSFSTTLNNLQSNTAYFVRAYATNGNGTSYGGTYQITTGPPSLAGVNTDGVNGITASSATATGTVVHQGGVVVTERGFCWSTSPNPSLQNNQGIVIAGSGMGGFVGNLSGLSGNTTYYVRAYATNSIGTSYGSQLQFITSPVPPTVITTTVSNVTAFTATSGGNVTASGGSAVTARGVCWSTSPSPTVTDNLTSNGSGSGSFTSNLTNLLPSTTYYVRAYAVNSSGTAYGNQAQFTTTDGSAVLSTTTPSNITAISATSGGTITSDGGLSITMRGVCWSTNPNPTTADNVTSNGTGTGTFTSNLTNLQPNTLYYVRAYALNGFGTAYGNEFSFTTSNGVPVLTTAAASSVTTNSAVSGGTILSDGGAQINARGVCYSTNPNPTIANNTTSDGIGSGSFSSPLTNLLPGTTYYVRAYASTTFGTGYGGEVQFTTQNIALPTVSTESISIQIGASVLAIGEITEAGGAPITSHGFCWSTSPNPTTSNNLIDLGTGQIGQFESVVTGLSDNTTYYFRAFAANAQGIQYGQNFAFSTPVFPKVTVLQPLQFQGNLESTWAMNWGATPDLTFPGNSLTGVAAFVSDGTPADSLGCNPLINGASIAGKIAVVYRGQCEFSIKALNAQQAGALAVVVINNSPGPPQLMSGGSFGNQVTISVVMIRSDDGQMLAPSISTGALQLFIGIQ
jgi:hypothetical protein